MGAHANNRPAEMLTYPEDPQFGKATPGKIAMWIFLVTDAMSFAGLLIAYAILRATKDWPNPIEALGGVDRSQLDATITATGYVQGTDGAEEAKNNTNEHNGGTGG